MPKNTISDAKYQATLAQAEDVQRSAKEGAGKYVHVPLIAIDAELSVTTTEYVTPTGDTGYQVISIADGGASSRSKATGPEAESRTWEWQKHADGLNL